MKRLTAAALAGSALVLTTVAIAAPALPIRDARRAAEAETLAFAEKQPWWDTLAVSGCFRGARPSVAFCHSRVRGLDTYQLNRLHVCKLTVKALLLHPPGAAADGVGSRIIARRCFNRTVGAN